ncbi:short chain dehydrogenase [Ilyonectria destructans]|nr:short chain dehydrogenase [Ilyonectria destructans]
MSKTILIVGANRGLGLQFALQYQAKGFNVYGTYRKESVDEAKELLDSGVKTITLDLADETSIKDASKSFGDQPLDFLINCAGKFQHSPKWIDTTTDEFMQRFRISAVGPYLTTKAFHAQLKKSPSPFVINISSKSGSIGENETGGNLSYRTAKAALNMITVDLARELAPDNISLVAMSPGWVQTKMSNWTGPTQSPEAVTLMIQVIDGLQPSDTATFYHRDGSQLKW